MEVHEPDMCVWVLLEPLPQSHMGHRIEHVSLIPVLVTEHEQVVQQRHDGRITILIGVESSLQVFP